MVVLGGMRFLMSEVPLQGLYPKAWDPGMEAIDRDQHPYLTASVYKVVSQKSMPTQICQLFMYNYKFKE